MMLLNNRICILIIFLDPVPAPVTLHAGEHTQKIAISDKHL